MRPLVTTAVFAFLAILALPPNLRAQQGTVTYEETVKIKIDLPPEMADMKDKIPTSQSGKKLLLFNEQSSIMKGVEEEPKENSVAHVGEGMTFKMKMIEAENETYVNFDEAALIEKRDFMGRTFLITGPSDAIQWKLTDERSEFLGYLCIKATAMRDSTALEAWFTPEVPVPAGPEEFGGLPGLILVLNVGDGDRTFVAKELSLEDLEDGAIEAPRKGKKVTRDEFDKIVADKMKEMGVQNGGKGKAGVMITIRN